MSAFESMIVVNHAKKLRVKFGSAKAAQYLASNGVDISVALLLVAGISASVVSNNVVIES